MRLTKIKKPKIEYEPYKQQNKTLISNYQKKTKEPSNRILNEIIQNNSSFNNLKESIKKESNTNIKDIFSSDESRLKAIKYVIQATSKENQKNERRKLRQNLSYISQDVPIIYNQKNKTKEKIKKSFYKKIDNISPIKTTVHKSKYIKNELDLTNPPIDILFQRSRINSNNIISQSEVNIQYLKNKTERNNNFSENEMSLKPNQDNLFYHKVRYVTKNNNNKRDRNNKIDYEYNNHDNEINEQRNKNRTINDFYVHKQINKSGIIENNNMTNNNSIKKYKNNNQGINVFYSTKNINYDIMYNFQENDSYNNHKNISKDEYYNFPNYNMYKNNKSLFNKRAKKKIHNSLYIPEVENESDTCPGENNFEKINYITNANKMHLGQKKKKHIIRVIDTSHNINNYDNDNYYGEKQELSPINLTRPKDRTLTGYNNSDNLELLINANTLNNNFSFHKKILTNSYNKKNLSYLNNSSRKNIIFKKKEIKDTNKNINNNDINKKIENEFIIYSNDSFSIFSKNKNKFIFENENDIIDFINNKFMKEKQYNFENNINYTGYTLIKKLKGKPLSEINIDDDINKFNKILKEENIKIGNNLVEIIPINDKEKNEIISKNINILENEIEKLKKENEALNKKDFLKNELINKLDKEKQKIIEENNKLMKDKDKLKKLNEELNSQLIECKSKNNQIDINKNYKEENIIKINITNKKEHIKEIDEKSNNMENKTPSSNEQSNILGTNNNINNSNIEIGMESKKNNNVVSLFRLSKVSEIKKIDNNNNDSDKREIKNNIDLLNEKLNDKNNKNKINPFNNNDD